jgi:hypothetical protein
MAASACGVIDDLREKIRRIEGRTPSCVRFVPSGWDRVDAMLPGGGFPRGALSELAGGRASGKTAIALSTLARATRQQGFAAFIDGRHELYPPSAAALGMDLERLLVVRPAAPDSAEGARAALWAAESVLASGAFEAVAVDVPLRPVHGQAGAVGAMLRRLRAAAEKGGAAALWLGVPGGVRIPCMVRLELSTGTAGWHVRRTHARGVHDSDPMSEAVVAVHHAA